MYLNLGHAIIFQNRISLHAANMGCRGSKRKLNKEGEKQKLCKIGLAVGRNDLKLEGNFQCGYHSKINKKYEAVDGKPLTPEEPLTPIPEEETPIPEEENGRVPDPTVLQS